MTAKKSSIKVEILGESYAIRSEADPEHTRACADHLDRAIRQILSGGLVCMTDPPDRISRMARSRCSAQARVCSGSASLRIAYDSPRISTLMDDFLVVTCRKSVSVGG